MPHCMRLEEVRKRGSFVAASVKVAFEREGEGAGNKEVHGEWFEAGGERTTRVGIYNRWNAERLCSHKVFAEIGTDSLHDLSRDAVSRKR